MKNTERPCEICGKSDVSTFVCSSTIGAVSFNTCLVCAGVGAEPKGMIEIIGEPGKVADYLCYYDIASDSYINYNTGKIRPITLKNGDSLQHRKEYVAILKKHSKENNNE